MFVVTQMDPRQTPKFEPPHQLAVHLAQLLLCSGYWHTGVQLMPSTWHVLGVMQERPPALPGPGLQAGAALALPFCRGQANSAI